MAKRGLAGVTIRQLKQEIARRQRRLATLQRRRRTVAAQLGELDNEIAALGPARGPGRPAGAKKKRGRPAKKKRRAVKKRAGTVKKKKLGRPKGKKKVARSAKKKTARGGTRARNKLSLGETLAKVLSASRPTRVTDAVKAVLKAGYKTKAKGKNFATIVNQALTSDKRFKKVARGQYVLAG